MRASYPSVPVERYLLALAKAPAPSGHEAVTSGEARSVLTRAAASDGIASAVYKLWLWHGSGAPVGGGGAIGAADCARAIQWALRELEARGALLMWRQHTPEPSGQLPFVEVQRLSVPEPPKPDTTHWIQFDVQDQTGAPIASVPYAILRGEEDIAEGKLDRFGTVYLASIEPGSYRFALGGSEQPAIEGDFLALELLDPAGVPFAGTRYCVVDSAGKRHEGALDGSGRAMVQGLEPGTCKVSFPDLPNDAWAME